MGEIRRFLVAIAVACSLGCGRPDPFAGLDFARGTDMAQPVESFSYSTGLCGELLLLAADGTYRRTARGCSGGVQEEGHFTRDDSMVTLLEPTRRSEPGVDPIGPQSRRLQVVAWGGRTYLIRDDDSSWLHFCNAVNAGQEPRSGGTSGLLLREGDERVAVTGLPLVPEAWAGFLLPEPVEGSTVEALADRSAWVSLGAEQHVRVGMEFWLPEMPLDPGIRHLWGGRATTLASVEVLEVEPGRCRVALNHQKEWSVPVGLIVSSRKSQDG